jgi:hypothetical protein
MAHSPVKAIADRSTAIGRLLLHLGESPELIADFDEALARGDTERFAAAFEQALGPFELPPEECRSGAQIVALIVRPPRFVWRCSSKSKTLSKDQSDEIVGMVGPGIETDAVLKLLAKHNVLRCHWQLEDPSHLLLIERYVQGACP